MPTIICALLLIVGRGSVDGQVDRQRNDCGGRGVLRMVALDQSGAVALPGAAVVVSWIGGVAAPRAKEAGR